MVHLELRLLSRVKPSLLRILAGAAVAVSGSFTSPTARADEGAPRLSAVGRFFGFGYSQHGYHSAYGRPASVAHSHPAQYPSGQLTQIYLPAHYAIPQTRAHGVGQFQPTGTIQVRQPNLAPQIPAGPPPKWLEPYLQGQGQSQSPPSKVSETSPSDLRGGDARSTAEEVEVIDLLGVGDSPYETELIPGNPNRFPGAMQQSPGGQNQASPPGGDKSNSGSGPLTDDLLNDSLLNENAEDAPVAPRGGGGASSDNDLLGADARYRYRAAPQTVQSTLHLYTPFR